MMQYNSKTLIFTEYLKYLRAKEVADEEDKGISGPFPK